MSDSDIRKLAKEIFIRNKQSEFSRLNLQRTGVSAVPQVAVFFIEETEEGFKLHGKSCNIQDGDLHEGIKSYPDNHCKIWLEIRESIPAWAKKNYLDVPWGRVVFDARNIIKPRFIVTLPVKFCDNKVLTQLVAEKYHLPEGKIKFKYEELY